MKPPLPAYLFWGDEFLARQAAQAQLRQLLPGAQAGLSLQILDGASPREVAAELSTLPLFPGPKVVLLHDPGFLAAPPVAKGGRKGGQVRDERPRESEDDASALVKLLDRGLPAGHTLMLVATEVDLKSPLVKKIQSVGEVVARKVETTRDGADLSEVIHLSLKPFGKRLGPGAEGLLAERCGTHMRLLQNELTKLALHSTGEVISRADVDALVGHVREEGYMDLGNALQKRDLKAALAYVAHAKEQGSHELMMLGAVASVVRGLLTTRERLAHLVQGSPPRSYKEFQSSVFPRIEKEAKALGTKVPHPYAAFKAMEAASQFSRAQLLASLRSCAEADLALKSSAPGMLVLERLLWTVCGQATAPAAV